LTVRIRGSPNRGDKIWPALHHARPQLLDSALAAVCLHAFLPKNLKNWSMFHHLTNLNKQIESQNPWNL
jgi:hypothetical protein